jgi:hypothetical protein
MRIPDKKIERVPATSKLAGLVIPITNQSIHMSIEGSSQAIRNDFTRLITSWEWIFAVLTLIVAALWLIYEPSFEPLHVVLTGTSAFLSVNLAFFRSFKSERNKDTKLNFSLGFRRIFGASSTLAFGLIFGLVFCIIFGLIIGIILGVIGGIIFGLSGVLNIEHNKRVSRQKDNWFGGDAKGRLSIGGGVGLICGAVFIISVVPSIFLLSWLKVGLSSSFIFGLLGGLFGALIGGFHSIEIKKQMPQSELIGQSLNTAAITGLFSGLAVWLVYTLSLGLSAGLSIGLSVGSAAFIQHFLLRFIFYPKYDVVYPNGHFFNSAIEGTNSLLQTVGLLKARIITNGLEIEEAQTLLQEVCQEFIESGNSKIWSKHSTKSSEDPARPRRYRNEFGFNKSSKTICEINIIGYGIDRFVGGAFVRDSLERFSLVHRGNKLTFIPKEFFESNFKGKWVKVIDGPEVNKVALVDELDSPKFGTRLTHFLTQVEIMKKQNMSDSKEQPFLPT